ncbi:hypothetical protein PINS_up006332 [Pythium insidiosum]|nr:hypothetical protein PINS_up006332 [Pythium insidiosum]
MESTSAPHKKSDATVDTSDLEAVATTHGIRAISSRVEALEQGLDDTISVLKTSHMALAAQSSLTDLEAAMKDMLQHLMTQLEDVAHSDDSTATEQRSPSANENATREFLSFLESRSKTQIRILEAEVRAGQELLRLHKAQHDKEVEQLENEMTALRLARTESEKLCVQLRSELRQTRQELTCCVASAAASKR